MALIRQLLFGVFVTYVSCFLMDNVHNVTQVTLPQYSNIDDLAQLLVEEKTQRLRLEVTVNTLYNQMTSLQATLNDKDQVINRTAQRVQNQEIQITQLENKLALVNATLRQQTLYDQAREDEVTQLHHQIANMNSTFKQDQANISMTDARVQILEQQITQLQNDVVTINTTTFKQHTFYDQNNVSQIIHELSDLQSAQINSTLTQYANEHANISSTLSHLQARVNDLDGQTYFFSVRYPNTQQPGHFSAGYLNQGNAYNRTSGTFTCKRAGVYLFTVTLMIHTASRDSSYCYINLNGSIKSYANAQTNDSTYESGTGSVFLHLQLNDGVTLDCANWDNVYGWTSFSGGLIAAD